MQPKFRSAFVPHDIKQPLKGADDGPLKGLTVAVKDMFAIAGERYGCGNPDWLRLQSPAKDHSAVVSRILAAGGTIIGKTVCDELFYSVTGANYHYGTPLNPKAPKRMPGGSSSGSASACASGACDLAVGSDTGGSVRVPASFCGLYGIRVTRGRIDFSGAAAMAPSFDAGGWFAPTPGLFGKLGPVLLRDWRDSTKDIAGVQIARDAFDQAEPAIAALCFGFLDAAKSALPQQHTIDLASDAVDRWREAMRITQAFEVWKTFGDFIGNADPKLGPGVAERVTIAASVTAADVARAKPVLDEATATLEAATANGRIIALPTCPTVAPLLTATPAELEDFRVRTMRLVCLASISGLPQITLPIGTVDGAPVGLSFIGWRNGEEELLALAKRLAPFVGFAA
jgi:amidase